MLGLPADASFCVLLGYWDSRNFCRTLGNELECSPRSGLGPGRSAAHLDPLVDAVRCLSRTQKLIPSLTVWSRPSAQSSAVTKVISGTCWHLMFFHRVFDSIYHDSISEICLFWISSKTGSTVLSCNIEYFHVACPLMMLFCLAECQLRIDNESQRNFQVFVGT